MADFRKMLYAFALVVLLVGIAAPASAQNMTCVYGGVRPLLRVESFVDLIGDITIDCTGGTPTTVGASVPRTNIYVYLNNDVTSKLTDTSQSPAFNDALLIIDEPNRTYNNSLEIFAHPILGCGNATAPYITGNTGVCDITATGPNPGTTYDGSAGHPNVYQGRQLPAGQQSGVWFSGVPIDPPGINRHRLIRITNIRINATKALGTTGSFGGNEVTANIITDPSTTIPSNQTPITVGLIQVGLASASGTQVGPYPQCVTGTRSGGSITVNEGFSSSFKPRNWSNFQGNGVYAGAPASWQLASGLTTASDFVDVNQNVPGVVWNTESGFVFYGATATTDPAVNPPPGISTTPGTALPTSIPFGTQLGMNTVGRASHGTRFQFRFSNIPRGSGASAPTAFFLRNSSGVNSGIAVYVPLADSVGAGGVPTIGTGSVGIPDAGASLTYEVLFSDYTAIEIGTLALTVNPVVDLGSTTVPNGTPEIPVDGNPIAQGQVGFAPYYAGSSAAAFAAPMVSPATGGGFPIPRFIPTNFPNPAQRLWSWNKCACDLLFPWVAGYANGLFRTDIVVANTSRDPGNATGAGFNASPQTGRVRYWFYGTQGTGTAGGVTPDGSPTVIVPAAGIIPSWVTRVDKLVQPGSYVAISIGGALDNANILDNGTATQGTAVDGRTRMAAGQNFAGYVIAQSEFRYCHGIAAISSNQPNFGIQTYIGLVMDNGTQLPARTNNLGENFGH